MHIRITRRNTRAVIGGCRPKYKKMKHTGILLYKLMVISYSTGIQAVFLDSGIRQNDIGSGI